jgi:hypothetical protein
MIANQTPHAGQFNWMARSQLIQVVRNKESGALVARSNAREMLMNLNALFAQLTTWWLNAACEHEKGPQNSTAINTRCERRCDAKLISGRCRSKRPAGLHAQSRHRQGFRSDAHGSRAAKHNEFATKRGE